MAVSLYGFRGPHVRFLGILQSDRKMETELEWVFLEMELTDLKQQMLLLQPI